MSLRFSSLPWLSLSLPLPLPWPSTLSPLPPYLP
jgi:hypothetical protein